MRISDIWGGTSRPWRVSPILAVLLALPLSAIGFAAADNPNTPGAARLLIAPGYVAAFHLPIYGGRFLGDLGRFVMSALAINACYYTVLLFGLMKIWRAVQRGKGDSCR